MSRIINSLRKNSQPPRQILGRFGASKSFSSLFRTKSGLSNTAHHQTGQRILRDPESLNSFKKFGSSKVYYSSSTNNAKRMLPLPEKDAASFSLRSFLVPASVLAGLFGGLAFFIHYNDERRATLKGQGEKFERSATRGQIIGGPFSLTNTDGQVVTEKNLLGNWVLMYFGYTSSPDIGPAEVQKMAKSIDILESKKNLKVLPIFVTIDPQRDTPSQLRAYINEFDTRITGLTGPVSAVRQMAQEYRVFFRKVEELGDDYLVESSHSMYLMNPNMQVALSFGEEYSAEELAEAITKEIQKAEKSTTVPKN